MTVLQCPKCKVRDGFRLEPPMPVYYSAEDDSCELDGLNPGDWREFPDDTLVECMECGHEEEITKFTQEAA